MLHLNRQGYFRPVSAGTLANTAIIEAQFSFTPTIGFPAAAQLTVDTTRALYGDVEAAQVQQAFADRGILAPPT